MKSILFLLITAFVLSSCKKDPEETPDFNKKELLNNVATNIIVPSIDAFHTDLIALKASFSVFENDKTQTNLDLVKDDWKTAYSSWQAVKMYDFGPILDNGIKASIGIFPTDTTQTLDNIASGSYNLSSAANNDAIGLSSLDYLLYKQNAFNDLINNSNYVIYISDVIEKMVNDIAAVQSTWNTYKNTFISSTGTESTSSFSQLINEFNKDFEIAKNAKLGIPLGKASLGIQLPEYIEARNSGYSLNLLRSSILSLQGLYNGDNNASSGSGVGFYEYLVDLDRSTLANNINSKFNAIIAKIDSFQNTLEDEMASNSSELDALYTLIHGQVINIKTDMPSVFGVLITYQDNDGD